MDGMKFDGLFLEMPFGVQSGMKGLTSGICMESAVLICYAMTVCRSSPRIASNHSKMATSWRENAFISSTEKHLFRFGGSSATKMISPSDNITSDYETLCNRMLPCYRVDNAHADGIG